MEADLKFETASGQVSAARDIPSDTYWNPKIFKICAQTGPERRPRNNFEKVAEKCANLGPCTCLNLVRGLRNTGFRVFRKDSK